MLCQKCKKQTATVHLTEVINNEKRERHLCQQCASNQGVSVDANEPINQLLAKFVLAQAEAQEIAKLTCSQCGTSFMDFRNSGLLGCPNDYKVFKEPLSGLLERAHEGRTQHVGKVPGGKENKHKRQHQLVRIKAKLDEAVRVEDYELAARLRDEIKALEQQ